MDWRLRQKSCRSLFFRINGVLLPTPRSQVTLFNKHEKLFFEIGSRPLGINGVQKPVSRY
ncbi:hypothetical protein B1P91_10045 [Enterococcus faecium]|nr:hypothetical protein B1P91_10045 [Enterococcus faecium]